MQQVNHGEAFSHDGACTNQAESLFSRFRRAEWGQYHRLSGIYLSRYASEIGWREDYGRESNGEQFTRLGARAAALAQSVDFTGRRERSDWQQASLFCLQEQSVNGSKHASKHGGRRDR